MSFLIKLLPSNTIPSSAAFYGFFGKFLKIEEAIIRAYNDAIEIAVLKKFQIYFFAS